MPAAESCGPCLRALLDVGSVYTAPDDPWMQRVFAICSARSGQAIAPRTVSYFTDAAAQAADSNDRAGLASAKTALTEALHTFGELAGPGVGQLAPPGHHFGPQPVDHQADFLRQHPVGRDGQADFMLVGFDG